MRLGVILISEPHVFYLNYWIYQPMAIFTEDQSPWQVVVYRKKSLIL